MSAKLLHALSDENPDLQKQIGCMTGIFQIFDRHHILTPKRITSYSNHKRPPSGHSHFSNSNHGDDSHNAHHQHTAKEKNPSKNMNENHRNSMESARPSFSSSTCSSSFSSVDYNKTTQLETSSFDQVVNAEVAALRDPSAMQANASVHSRKSSDFRDVVKDSIYKEGRSLSVKTTTKEESVSSAMKHRDSPRPLFPSRSVDGSNERGVNGSYRVPNDLKDTLHVLAKLQETPRHFHDTREPSRSSYEARDRTSFSALKDTPRFSYDGRETSRSSFESRDTFKSTAKARELPRLSLDSRASSVRGSDSDAKSNSFLKDFQRDGVCSNKNSSTVQGMESHKQNHSVVAKLMGLETMPKSSPPTEGRMGLNKICTYPADNIDSFSRLSRTTNDCKQNSISPRSSIKESVSPRLRNPDSVMKPLSNSRFPIEPAPWRDGGHGVQKPVFRSRDSPPRGHNASPSVYAEIEKRLTELEFKQSDKDLRALKQILDAMQAKGLLETKKKGDQGFVFERNYVDPNQNIPNQNPRLARRSPISTHPASSTTKGASSPRTFESPIVIMKPAKFIEKSGIPASSVIHVDGLSGPRKIRNGNSMDIKKSVVNNRMGKDLTPKLSPREFAKQPLGSTDKKANNRNLRSTNSPARSQQLPRDNMVNLGRNSGSVSPRLQQKKLDLEKRSRPPTPVSDLSKPRKISLRQQTDSSSPGGRRRSMSPNLQHSDDQMSEVSGDTRNMSHPGDEISLRSDSNISSASQIDIEVTSADRSGDVNNAFFHQGSRIPSMKVNMISSLKQTNSSPRLSEEGSVIDFTTVAPEQPSPVSVLDASFYSDDMPSPERNISEPFTDGIQNSDGLVDEYKHLDYLSDNKELNLSIEINRKKLKNVEQLVQKLRRLNSDHNEATTDYIASLCENTNPDHRYISEILLASGLLLRDLGSGLTTIQLHKSGHAINPDLFFVLEQTKASNGFSKDRNSHEQVVQSKSNQEKVHRKLVFDSVNEILEAKLASPELWQPANKLAGKTLNGQQLLKELCSEIEQLEANENLDCSFDDDDDFLKTILCKDVVSQSESWTDYCGENSGVVLDVERLIFKDLIDEIISGEASSLRAKPGRRRQLFAK
ncbi:Longifolia-like protein [Thalictrum thalictroides]|uniref:Longifolia-like protein n=1 Tax=Thalictrum thalictroides TaxID=46969 RepID=A0A7J6V9S9_THATH|nr:Longifolia-like protein [Thalictrum thalictroides]